MKQIDRKKIEDIFALTPMQEGMLFHYLKNPDNNYYFEQLSLDITGEIDVEIFNRSWNFVLETNEMLRTVFRWEKIENPLQLILKEYRLQPLYYDLMHRDNDSDSEKKTSFEEIKDRDSEDTFDLTDVPFRVTLCKIEDNRYRVIISNHHILYDGWSNGIILNEFFQTYSDFINRNELIKPVKTKFKEFVKWMQERDIHGEENFWRNHLDGYDTAAELSVKRKKVKEVSVTGPGTYRIRLKKETKTKLEDFIKIHKITLASFIYSAWGLLLHKYNNVNDVIFGTTVSGRPVEVPGIEDMVGLFINTIPLRVRAFPGEKTADWLYRMDNILKMRGKYEQTPLLEIKAYSEIAHQEELFDTIVIVENYPLDSRLKLKNSKFSVDSYSMVEKTHYDLTVGIEILYDIEIAFHYAGESLAGPVVRGLAGHFIGILQDMMQDPGKEVAEIDILSEEEKREVLVDFNRTGAGYPENKTINRLFEEQAEQTPNYVALVGQITNKDGVFGRNIFITYKELNEKSVRVAYILKERGVKLGTIVNIMVERSVEMIIGLLGILKAGGAYLPIDPEYPEERIEYMIADSSAKILVTSGSLEKKVKEIKKSPEIFFIDCFDFSLFSTSHHLNVSTSPSSNLAYVIYTSGSMGKPKGVMVQHGNVVRLVKNTNFINTVLHDKLLLTGAFVFDITTFEIWYPLLNGLTLYLSDRDLILKAGELRNFLVKNKITILHLIPQLFNELANQCVEIFRGLRYFLVGGDLVRPRLINRLRNEYPGIKILHCYGPTENTTFSTTQLVERNYLERLPIGKPIRSSKVYIMNRQGGIQPIGVVGELYTGGAGVARGYLNKPELTFERFINYKINNKKFLRGFQMFHGQFLQKEPPGRRRHKIYKTGDLARWLSNGTIEFLGRIDHQLKIRGFRIELGEIENCLLEHPAVRETVVTSGTDSNGSHFICAYMIPFSRGDLEISLLRDYLKKKLPAFMVPAHFVTLDQMPLTSTGKIDRKSLPPPKAVSSKPYMAPGNEIEARLVEIWSELLGIEACQIGSNDNFFELGGHSLKVVGLIGRIHKKLNIKIPFSGIFETPTVQELAGYIGKRKESGYDAVPPAEKREYYTLSSVQGRLYFLYRMAPGGIVYNMTGLMQLEGYVETGKLETVFQKIVARHESLRTSFHMRNEVPVQRIHDERGINFGLTGVKFTANETLPVKKIIKNFIRPFDLSRAPLLRVGLIREEDQRYVLILDMHHIISDGFSIDLLIKEFTALYRGETLPALGIQYRDFSEWQGSKAQQDKLKQEGAFWLEEFQEEIPVLQLPIDYPRPAVQGFEGREIHFHLDAGQTRALNMLALSEGATLFMVLLSVFTLLLSKTCNQEEIIIGTPVAGRRHPDLEHIMGMFVNTLPLRNFPRGEKTFKEFLGEVKERTLKAFSHQDYPYADLVEQVVKERDASRSPLFDVLFVQQEAVTPAGGMEVSGSGGNSFKIKPYPYENLTTKFDLCLVAVEIEGAMHFTFEYCVKLFKKETLIRFTHYFKELISKLLAQPLAKLAELEIITEREKHRILYQLNDTTVEFSRAKVIHRLFEEQVQRLSDHTALVGKISDSPGEDYIAITYNELNRKANQLAYLLIKEKGVHADTIVAIMSDRSVDMIVGILGILKAGGAYLPVDSTSPAQRIISMIADCQASVFLAKSTLMPDNLYTGLQNRKVKVLMLDQYRDQLSGEPVENLTAGVKPGNLVYCIFTSGSTGKPKGVLVEHSSLNNLVNALRHRVYNDYEDNLKVSLVSPFVFDASIKQIFPALSLGHRLYIVPEEVRFDGSCLLEFYNRNMIDITDGTPGHIQLLLNSPGENTLTPDMGVKLFLIGGEALPRKLVSGFYDRWGERGVFLANCYGPTECCDVTNLYPVEREEIPLYQYIPIGKLLGNVKAYILGHHQELQPIGIPGELFIAGPGLARGYLNRPGLTFEKFINYKLQNTNHKQITKYKSKITNTNKATSNINNKKFLRGVQGGGFYKKSPPGRRRQKIYKTGDLARWLAGGNIEYLSRIDQQVKIRGFRVEPGEIENKLLGCDGIKEAVVLLKKNEIGDNHLCAYIVGNNRGKTGEIPGSADLREYLSPLLPGYMIPSFFITLDKIPLTPNGKIDRKALPGAVPGTFAGDFVSPRDDIEMKLVEIWSESLDIPKEKISIHDNFFYLGGHSLKAALLAARINKNLNVSIPLLEIFRMPILKDLAEYIKKNADPLKYISIKPVEKREYYVLSSAQKRLYVIQQMDPGSTVYNMPAVMTLLGELHREKFAGIFNKLIHRQETLRTSFHMLKEKPLQKVQDKVNFEIEYSHLQSDSKIPGTSLNDMVEHFVRPFDLAVAPLLRVRLIKKGAQKHILMIDMNHIISDGTSMGIFINEFMTLNAGKDPGPLRTRYRDWAHWQNHENNSEKVKTQETYWLSEFEGKIPVLNLPCDYTRPTVQDFAGKRVVFALPPRDTEYLKTLALQEEVTLYMLLLSVYYVLLYKLTGQEDIVIGAPTAGRFQVELQKLIGMFLNTLALRNFPSGAQPFKIFLREVKAKVLKAFENQEYQFDDLVDRLELKKGSGRNPLFDVMFILQNQARTEIKIPGLKLIPGEIERTTTKFDLSLYAEEVGHELLFSITFCEKLFTSATITLIIDYFKAILSSVINNPDQALSDINVIPEGRRTAILSQLNTDLEGEAKNIIVGGIFQTRLNSSFTKFKDNIAIEYTCQSMSYAELDRRSARVCRWILDNGIARETFVGILMDNRLDVIVTVIGIIKAGCVIVPFYPGYPINRIIDMLQVTHLQYLFIDQGNMSRLNEPSFPSPGKIEMIDPQVIYSKGDSAGAKEIKKTPVHYTPDDALYIHFTSGTTRKPRAILGRNKGLLHFISWEIETFGISSHFRSAQFTIPGFDPFLRDVFAPILAGGIVCIPEDEEIVTRPVHLAEWVDMRRISLIHCVTGLFRLLISSGLTPDRFRNLEYILLAGEKTNPSDLVEWYEILGEGVQLVNGYGPTETTMSKAYYLISPRDMLRERIPIGKPLKGARIVILDEKGELCAPLLPGEICIRTPFRSLGYYDARELNQEKFISNPFSGDPGDILYRSGDLGRILADGNLDILGRIDRQVKIRGYRVELEEVEGQLAKHPLVNETVVMKKGTSSETEFLCAYITITAQSTGTPADQETLITELKESLSRKLPDYMVPANIIIIDMVPRKATGKVDHDRLPDPIEKRKTGYIPPGNQIEEKLITLWSEILKIEKIGINDHFFELGGNSLNAVSLISKIHSEFDIKIPVAQLFNFQTVSKQARLIKKAGKDKMAPIEPAEEKEYYTLSAAQKRLYVLQQIDQTGISYNISRQALLEGDIDKITLEQTFIKLLRRHESLRTSFLLIEDEPLQKIHEDVEFEIEYYVLDSDEENYKLQNTNYKQIPNSKLQILNKKEAGSHHSFVRPFDLSRSPLVRIGLINIGEKKQILMLDMHHIITDGFSESILFQDFMGLYNKKEFPPLRLQYKDFSQWQTNRLHKIILKSQEKFWLKQFRGEIPVLNLPCDFPRPSVRNFEGSTFMFDLDEKQTAALNQMASANEATLYMVLISITDILLSKLSGQEEIVIGTPNAGRVHPDSERIIGMFVNTLALINSPNGEKTFAGFLGEVKRNTLDCFENQEYPFESLVDTLSPDRDTGRNPLFDVMFALQNIERPSLEIPGLRLIPLEFERITARFDLIFTAFEQDKKLYFNIEYSTTLFKKETIERFVRYFKRIALVVHEEPGQRLSEIEFLSGKEKKQVLFEFNNTKADYPWEKTIHGLFKEQSEITPDNIALAGPFLASSPPGQDLNAFHQMHLSYRELNKKSHQLAVVLRNKGVCSDTIVGISLERSIAMIVCIFGILKAGGVYLPIDPGYPEERKKYMLADSGIKVVVTSASPAKEAIPNIESISIETLEVFNFPSSQLPDFSTSHSTNLAYVIYTSGSTGRPRGVMVEHHSVINRLLWMQHRYPLGHDDVILQKTTFTFDVSVWELFWWSFRGASLFLLEPGGEKNPAAIVTAIARHRISTMHFVPSMLNAFLGYLESLVVHGLDMESLGSLKQVFVSGEALLPHQVQRFNALLNKINRTWLINLYGPTEATVDVSYFDCPGEGEQIPTNIPIGKPIENIRLYVLDKNMCLQPMGIPGELHIAGVGTARGYLNRPQLTREKFVRVTGQKLGRSRQTLYKSGDWARWLPGGNIEFLGRMDFQVKIHGFRIELGEIENHLMKHPQVREAVVIDVESNENDKYLCACIRVKGDKKPNIHDLQAFLSGKLPHYMIPNNFIHVETIPLTPSGKVDRKTLQSQGIRLSTGMDFEEPRDEIEERVAGTWKEILKLDRVGINDSFFSLGGNSINLIRVNTRLKELFDHDIPITKMFEHFTIKSLSNYLKQLEKGSRDIESHVEKETEEDAFREQSLNIMEQTMQIIKGEKYD